MSLAFVFPGQGSQSIGMLSSLANLSPVIEATFAESSAVLGYDLWERCQHGPKEALDATECQQPAMLTAGVAVYRLWRERGGSAPTMLAGHSLGEFSALVVAGCLAFDAAVDLVRFRAQAMQSAVPAGLGAMAAVLGLDDEQVLACCARVTDGVVEAVNFNAPGQVVIAGQTPAVAAATELLRESGARRVMPLPITVPAHSSLMRPAAERLRERLVLTAMAPTRAGMAVYGVDSKARTRPDEIRAAVVKQLHTAVHWADTVRAMIADGATRVVECGSGRVLTALNRRIDKRSDIQMASLEDEKSLTEVLAS